MISEPLDLTNYNSYRVQARARRGLVPPDASSLVQTLRDEPGAIVIGSGHNLILRETWYDDVFIVVSIPDLGPEVCRVNGDEIEAYAGVSMIELSSLAMRHGLSGLEHFYDIPSSLGGAVVMNAGASGEEIKDVLVEVEVFDRTAGEVRTLTREQIGYGYRQSVFQQRSDLVVVSARLRLAAGDPHAIQERMESIKAARWAKQPRDYPNAGSVFKRPPGRFVGPMIDELGLKGFRVGGAEVSRKHGGFIINVGDATGRDILGIIERVQFLVREKFGVDLDQEQIVI